MVFNSTILPEAGPIGTPFSHTYAPCSFKKPTGMSGSCGNLQSLPVLFGVTCKIYVSDNTYWSQYNLINCDTPSLSF